MLLTVGDARVFVKERGAGEPVLLLHGNPDSADLWDPVTAVLSQRFRCLAPDLPAFGRSSAPPAFDTSFEGLGRFVDALVAGLDIDRPLSLVGHDFGGAFAMAWAILRPERVRRVAVINHPFFVAGYRWHLLARIWRTPLLGELSTVAMGWWPIVYALMRIGSKYRLSEAHIRHTHSYLTPVMKRMILSLYRSADPKVFERWQARTLALTARVPTLVLWGDRDPYIPPWVADAFGTERVRHFPDRGHWLPAEAPDEVAAALLEFFTDCLEVRTDI